MSGEIEVTDASIEFEENDEYNLRAHGKMAIEGPLGKLSVLKTYCADPKYEDLMSDDEIHEHKDYYHPDSNYEDHPYTDSATSWNHPIEEMDENEFIEECEAAMMGDPEIEYEEALRGTKLGISEPLDDAHQILMASEGRVGLTEAQAEAYSLREVHDVPRKWAAIALGKDPSGLDNLQRNAREKVKTIQRVADAIESVEA